MQIGPYKVYSGTRELPEASHITANGRKFTVVPNYDFPGRFSPRRHQVETWGFFLKHKKCFCLDGLGLGKTLSAIWAMDYLLKAGIIRRVLIIAPLSICSYVWERELFKTVPWYHTVLVKGDRRQKQKITADTDNKILIINPESLHIIKTLPEVDLIIVDEFTKFKNARSRRYKALKLCAEGRRLWLLSGTPAPQSPLDAYAPVMLVRDQRLSFLSFRDQTMRKVSQFTWVPRPGAENIVASYMQPAIRHKVSDCIDLPAITINNINVNLTKAQQDAIQSFLEKAKTEIEGNVITATTAAAVLSKCLQIMGGGVYDTDKEVNYLDAKPYFEAVIDTVEQADTPVLIFVPFRSTAEATYKALEKAGFKIGLITGAVNTDTRSQYFSQVQSGSIDALVAVAGTMAHGLTLTTARYVLWACPPYSYEEYEQANGRVYRPGQSKLVIIYHLIQNKMAADLFRRLKNKEKLQQTVLKLIQENS